MTLSVRVSEHDASLLNPNPSLGDLSYILQSYSQKNSDNWNMFRYKSALLLKATKNNLPPPPTRTRGLASTLGNVVRCTVYAPII